MDINLAEMLGSEATEIIRQYESQYSVTRTNIVAVSVEGEEIVMKGKIFDDYCKYYF
jgi:hypothetical protein